MTLRITILHNGVASIRDITTDPKGNVTVQSLLLQCGIKRTKNELVWVKRDGAKRFRSKPLGDFSHLLKQHHENATIVVAPLMPKASVQLPLSLPAPSSSGQNTAPTQSPVAGPSLPTTPSRATRDRRPSRATERRKSARDHIRRQMRQRRDAGSTGSQSNTGGSQLISMQYTDSNARHRFDRTLPIRRLS